MDAFQRLSLLLYIKLLTVNLKAVEFNELIIVLNFTIFMYVTLNLFNLLKF